jgi:hypothetical protein
VNKFQHTHNSRVVNLTLQWVNKGHCITVHTSEDWLNYNKGKIQTIDTTHSQCDPFTLIPSCHGSLIRSKR